MEREREHQQMTENPTDYGIHRVLLIATVTTVINRQDFLKRKDNAAMEYSCKI